MIGKRTKKKTWLKLLHATLPRDGAARAKLNRWRSSASTPSPRRASRAVALASMVYVLPPLLQPQR